MNVMVSVGLTVAKISVLNRINVSWLRQILVLGHRVTVLVFKECQGWSSQVWCQLGLTSADPQLSRSSICWSRMVIMIPSKSTLLPLIACTLIKAKYSMLTIIHSNLFKSTWNRIHKPFYFCTMTYFIVIYVSMRKWLSIRNWHDRETVLFFCLKTKFVCNTFLLYENVIAWETFLSWPRPSKKSSVIAQYC